MGDWSRGLAKVALDTAKKAKPSNGLIAYLLWAAEHSEAAGATHEVARARALVANLRKIARNTGAEQ